MVGKAHGPRVPGKKYIKYFPVTVKIRTSRYQTLECFIATLQSQHRECMGVLCTWMKLLRDLHILGCELHKNELSGRTPPGIAGGAIAPATPPNRYKAEGTQEKGRKGLELRMGGKWRT